MGWVGERGDYRSRLRIDRGFFVDGFREKGLRGLLEVGRERGDI